MPRITWKAQPVKPGLGSHRWAPLGCALMHGWESPVAPHLCFLCHAVNSPGSCGTPKRGRQMSSAFGILYFKKIGAGFAVSLVPWRERWWPPETFAR